MIFSLFRWWTRGDGWRLICIIIISYLYKYDMIRISLSINRRIRLYIYRSWYESILGGEIERRRVRKIFRRCVEIIGRRRVVLDRADGIRSNTVGIASNPAAGMPRMLHWSHLFLYRFSPLQICAVWSVEKCGIKEKKNNFWIFLPQL